MVLPTFKCWKKSGWSNIAQPRCILWRCEEICGERNDELPEWLSVGNDHIFSS